MIGNWNVINGKQLLEKINKFIDTDFVSTRQETIDGEEQQAFVIGDSDNNRYAVICSTTGIVIAYGDSNYEVGSTGSKHDYEECLWIIDAIEEQDNRYRLSYIKRLFDFYDAGYQLSKQPTLSIELKQSDWNGEALQVYCVGRQSDIDEGFQYCEVDADNGEIVAFGGYQERYLVTDGIVDTDKETQWLDKVLEATFEEETTNNNEKVGVQ